MHEKNPAGLLQRGKWGDRKHEGSRILRGVAIYSNNYATSFPPKTAGQTPIQTVKIWFKYCGLVSRLEKRGIKMNIRHLAAAAALALSCGSLPAVAAPIVDRGAHYIIKFEGFGQADAPFAPPNLNKISGQITIDAGAAQNGAGGNQYASAAEFYRPSVVDRPYGILSMNVSINDDFLYGPDGYGSFDFDLHSAQRVLDQKNSLTNGGYRESSVELSVGAYAPTNGAASEVYAYLTYFTDYLTLSGYYDLKLQLVGDLTGGTVSGNYGTDGGQAFGCYDIRCTFTTTYSVAVPEPASLALLGTGVVGLMAMRRRRKAA